MANRRELAELEAKRQVMFEKKFTPRLKRLLKLMLTSLPQTDDPLEFVRRMKMIVNNPRFLRESEKLARSMGSYVAKGQFNSWREACVASTRGRDIFRLLKKETEEDTFVGQTVRDIVRRNADLIKTCPLDMSKELTEMIRKRQMSGLRPEEIMKEVESRAWHLTDVEAKRIARAESAKAATALREARARKYNRAFYIWWSCSDARVRNSHAKMHNVLCRWDDPPNPEKLAGENVNYGAYHPGNIFNCRCIPLSVISFRDLKFPMRCHINGQIRSVGNIKALRALYSLPDDVDGEFAAENKKG